MNTICLTGNVGSFELRHTQGGEPILNFSVAVRRSFKRENQPDTDWFNCTLFGKRAEGVSKYFSKGMRVGVVGRGEWREWTDKQGGNRKDLQVIAESIDLLSPPNHGTESDANNLPY